MSNGINKSAIEIERKRLSGRRTPKTASKDNNTLRLYKVSFLVDTASYPCAAAVSTV